MEVNKDNRWSKCLEIFRDNLEKEQYEAWFAPTSVKSFTDGTLTLSVPTQFCAEHIEKHFFDLVQSTLLRVYEGIRGLKYEYYTVKGEADTAIIEKGGNIKNNDAATQPAPMANPFEKKRYPDFDSQLNSSYTFDNYCLSRCNKAPYVFAMSVATKPNCHTFSPMFIYGKTGVGKTHLVQALGNKVKEVSPTTRVLYLSARTFESQYTTAVRNNTVNDFLYFYMSIDMLIIDDVQEFAGKRQTQNTLFEIFNYLTNRNKHIIMTSDCPPSELDGMEERMLSRFKFGVIAELESPDYELRKTVFKRKAEEANATISSDIVDYVAEHVKDNVRELSGVFTSLLAYSIALDQPFSMDLAKSVISRSIKVSKRQVTFDRIVEVVCAQFAVKTDQLFSKSRKREVADSRQLIMALAKKYTNMSSTVIGVKLNRNHATVLHACKTIEERLSVDREFTGIVSKIENAIAS